MPTRPRGNVKKLPALQVQTLCCRTAASSATSTTMGQGPQMQHDQKFDPALLPITQDHDGGAAAAAKVRQLGYEGLSVHPVGGARFTHWSRQLNFEWILCDLWKHQGARFSTVVVVWAGNDLKWWMTPEELKNAISSLKESCTKWQVELRLIDVVGRSYF